MQARDRGSLGSLSAGMPSPALNAVSLEELCPKLKQRRWRRSLHELTAHTCIYCGRRSESIDHVHPQSRGGSSVTENCVPACLACNGHKGDGDVFQWYRQQPFYDPRRAMAIRAWLEGDLRLAIRLLEWSAPHHTRQATGPLCRWQIAA